MSSTVGRPRATFSTMAQLASEMARPRNWGSSVSQCGSDIGRSSTASSAVRKVLRTGDPMDWHRLVKTLQRPGPEGLELNVAIGKFLAGFGRVDMAGCRFRFQPRRQMLRRTTNLIDLGKFAGDHIGDDESRVETDPDLEPGITQAFDAPDQLKGGVASQWRVIRVCER